MLSGKSVLIVSSNYLICLGLKTLLTDYFSAESVAITADLNGSSPDHAVDYLFLQPETFALHQDEFRGIKTGIIILTSQQPSRDQLLPAALQVTCPESEIIEQLQHILSQEVRHKALHKNVNLSEREVEVLKLVAQGELNKQIADKLSISLHTVISHRKNITRKLGIKTVSGLTMYAVLHGLISSRDIR